jgi:hypothetical protein
MKESRKEFILDLHSRSDIGWQKKIEREFPKLFKKDALIITGWNKVHGRELALVFMQGNKRTYGFDASGDWTEIWCEGIDYTTYLPATDKEVKQALIKEAKRLGFKEGVVADLRNCGHGVSNAKIIEENYRYNGSWLSLDSYIIFEKGKWAEIVGETITKEEAEKE